MTDTARRAQLWELIKDIHFGMFTTRHANGHLHSRPMTTQNRAIDEDDSLWFFMSAGSETVADLLRDNQVNVAYSDPEDQAYVSVAGQAEIVEDDARKQALWSRANEAWFQGGPTDPDLTLVRVRIAHADYWDAPGNRLVHLYDMAVSALTGEPPKDKGERGRVDMR